MLRRGLAWTAAAALALAPALAALPAQAAAASPTVRLSGDVLAGLAGLRPLGAAAPGTPVQVALVLADPHAPAEQAAYRAIYTPGSPDYHHFLTPAQYAARFGFPAARLAAARAFATSGGLRVVREFGADGILELSGTAAQAERTFGVRLADYRYRGLDFYANTAAPRVPAGLGVLGVVGLNSAQRMHTFHSAPPEGAPHGPKPATDTCDPTSSVCVGITTPQDLWHVYQQPAADQGQGASLAIFGEGAWSGPVSDLRLFEKHFGFPQLPVKVIAVDNGPISKYTDTSGDIEWDLDTQASTGMAPQVSGLDLYFGTSLADADVLNMFATWSNDSSGPAQASASFGECEADPANDALPPTAQFAAGETFTAGSERVLGQANLEGRTLFSSAGDTGSSCPLVPVSVNGVGNEAFPDVNYPCASPHVVCAGGTVLYTDAAHPANRVSEYSWPYTGGGTSFEFPEPGYQKASAGVNGLCLYGPGGNPAGSGVACRGVPDVAAQSGDVVSNGYDIYISGQFSEEGGTSLSSPLWDGMWARIQAASRGTGPAPGAGFADEALYRHPGDFFDVGAGTPASPPTANGYYHSGPGWDYLSGLGAPRVSALAEDITGHTTPAHDVAAQDSGAVTVVGANGAVLSSGMPVASDPACVPLWTDTAADGVYPLDPTGTDYPQLDIVAGNMHNSATTLRTVLTVADLQDGPAATPPYGTANEYYMYWTYRGTTYFTNAEVSAAGTVSYNYGTVNSVGSSRQYSDTGTATGRITPGRDGTVEVDVPRAAVGAPASGDALTGIGGETDELVGAPGAGGSLQAIDTDAASYPYRIDETCAATGQPGSDGGAAPGGGMIPEAPAAVLMPLAGLAVLGGLVARRRAKGSG